MRATAAYPSVPQHTPIAVVGCPGLEKLDDKAATGGLVFPRRAKASFTYVGGPESEVSEELHSDTAAKLSEGIGEIFDAMVSCPSYRLVSGSTVIDVDSQRAVAPHLGDEQWSQLITYSVGGQRSVVRQSAILTNNVLVVVSGSPGLVDANLDKALTKAQIAH